LVERNRRFAPLLKKAKNGEENFVPKAVFFSGGHRAVEPRAGTPTAKSGPFLSQLLDS
jgi:hypothetical protein